MYIYISLHTNIQYREQATTRQEMKLKEFDDHEAAAHVRKSKLGGSLLDLARVRHQDYSMGRAKLLPEIGTHTHTYTHTHTHTSLSLSLSFPYTWTHTRTHAHTHTCAHTRARARAHTHTHAHTHAHTHTHTRQGFLLSARGTQIVNALRDRADCEEWKLPGMRTSDARVLVRQVLGRYVGLVHMFMCFDVSLSRWSIQLVVLERRIALVMSHVSFICLLAPISLSYSFVEALSPFSVARSFTHLNLFILL